MRLLTTPPLGERARAPFALLVALTACGTLGMHIIIPALPAAARAMEIPIGVAQLTITLYLIGLAIGQLIYGPLSDRFGRRPVLLAGMSLFTLASLCTAFISDPWVMMGARFMQALGGCGGLVLGRAAVRDGASAEQAAGQLALLTLTMSMVPAIAPALGGVLTGVVHWRASFALLAVIGGVTLLATILILPETNRATRPPGFGSLARGNLRLLRSRVFLGFAVGGACSTTSFYAFMAAAPFIFEQHMDRGPEAVGVYYLILMVGVALGSFLANRLAKRVTVAGGITVSNGFALAGALAFALANLLDAVSVPVMVGTMFVFMIGAGMTSPFALAGSISADPRLIGSASGLYGFFQMGFGMLCTVAVEVWTPGAIYPVSAILLTSALLGALVIRVGAGGRQAREG
jgi:DHA1 family bicyclomycin/chloramphenicol resistance-like MFS transporter